MLLRATIYSNFSLSCAINVRCKVILDIPVEALRITDESIVSLAGMVDFSVDIFTGAGTVVFFAAFNDSDIVVSASYALDWRTDMVTALFADTAIGDALGIDVDVLSDMERDMWAVSIIVLACILMLLPFLEVLLLFGSEACSCWPTASRNCPASQPRMPSYQV